MVKDNFEISIKLDSRIFSKNGIMKCLYWYSNDYRIDVVLDNDLFYNILISPLNKDISTEALIDLDNQLNQDFIDYNLRDIVKNETSTIRELIIAKAFSNGEFDEDPKGELMDPIGIKKL